MKRAGWVPWGVAVAGDLVSPEGVGLAVGSLQEAVRLAREKEQELAAKQDVCNETVLALWEECKPCLKHSCMRFYSRTCHSGSGLVGRQVSGPTARTHPHTPNSVMPIWGGAFEADSVP